MCPLLFVWENGGAFSSGFLRGIPLWNYWGSPLGESGNPLDDSYRMMSHNGVDDVGRVGDVEFCCR